MPHSQPAIPADRVGIAATPNTQKGDVKNPTWFYDKVKFRIIIFTNGAKLSAGEELPALPGVRRGSADNPVPQRR